MKERSLVWFTLLAQASVGVFFGAVSLQLLAALALQIPRADRLMVDVRSAILMLTAFPLICLAFLISLAHLGAPRHAWKAVRNLGQSWLSREIVFGLLYALFLGLTAASYLFSSLFAATWFTAQAGAAICGLAFLYSMARVYMQRTILPWNSSRTLWSFLLTAASLGALVGALVLAVYEPEASWTRTAGTMYALTAALALAIQAFLRLWQVLRPARTNPLQPGQPRRQAPPAPRIGWVLACLLLAILTVLLAAWLPVLHWQLLLASLLLAVTAEAIARFGFYASYNRAGI